jgi:hypothetical protein
MGIPSDEGRDAPPATEDELAQLRVENDALRARLSRRATIRKWLAVVLVVLTSLSVLVSTVAVWAHQTVFDTDRFMETVGPAFEDPALYSSMSDYVSEQTLAALDIEGRVTEGLSQLDEFLSEALVDAIDPDPRVLELLSRFDRPSLTALAPSISTALETRVVAVIDGFITSDEFAARLPELVRRAHAATIALIRNELAELPNVYIEDGDVRLNLIPLITEVLQRVLSEIRDFLPDVTLPAVISDRVDQGREELGAALRARLPEDFAQLTVMSEDKLVDVQDMAQRVDRAVWALILLTIVLLGATIALSPNRRRTLVQLAFGVVVSLVVAMVVVRRLETAILDAITSVDGQHAARALYAEVVSSLRRVTVIVAVTAIVIGVVAYLAGRPRWLTRLGERGSRLTAPGPEGSELDRWIGAHFDALRIAGVALAVVVVFFTGIELVPVILVAGALALYLWAITEARRRITSLQPVTENTEAEPTEATTP